MPPAAANSPSQELMPSSMQAQQADVYAKDATIAWFRSEFAAANAIIDALCGHLAQLSGGGGEGSEYEGVFKAIHRRRLNWIPVIQMQKYHSVGDVRAELKRVYSKKTGSTEEDVDEKVTVKTEEDKVTTEINGGEASEEDSLKSDVTDSGSQEVHPVIENIDVNICANHGECDSRPGQIKLTKGFSAKEQVKGHTANVVKGLKLYEDLFTDSELSKLTDFVSELRAAGQKGELSGHSFILFNKQMKGNRREMIQFGVPIYGQIKEDTTDNKHSVEETIPPLLQGVIDHLVQWHILPEHRKPNSCIISFYDEDEFSQPFLKPPHLEQPISTLLLSDSTMAFGRMLAIDSDGNCRAPLTLSLSKGSLLVMRGNSADMAGNVMCRSSNKRISITFSKVRPDSIPHLGPASPPPTTTMTLCQPGVPTPYAVQNGARNGYEAMDAMPKWGVLPAPPVVMLAPVILSPSRISGGGGGGGTGVYLPSGVESRKPIRHLPPRAQKGRAHALASHAEEHDASST